jgi:heme/copper-type cytochrome/quinol oxidase subunit 2
MEGLTLGIVVSVAVAVVVTIVVAVTTAYCRWADRKEDQHDRDEQQLKIPA